MTDKVECMLQQFIEEAWGKAIADRSRQAEIESTIHKVAFTVWTLQALLIASYVTFVLVAIAFARVLRMIWESVAGL